MWTLLEQNPGAVTALNSDLRQLHRFVLWGHVAPMLHELRWLSNSVLRPKSTTRHFQPSNSSAGGLWCYYGANAMPSALCPKVSVPQCPDEGTDGGHHRFFLEFLTDFLPVETRGGSGGGEMHAGSLSNVLSGCRYDSSEAPPWLPREMPHASEDIPFKVPFTGKDQV